MQGAKLGEGGYLTVCNKPLRGSQELPDVDNYTAANTRFIPPKPHWALRASVAVAAYLLECSLLLPQLGQHQGGIAGSINGSIQPLCGGATSTPEPLFGDTTNSEQAQKGYM